MNRDSARTTCQGMRKSARLPGCSPVQQRDIVLLKGDLQADHSGPRGDSGMSHDARRWKRRVASIPRDRGASLGRLEMVGGVALSESGGPGRAGDSKRDWYRGRRIIWSSFLTCPPDRMRSPTFRGFVRKREDIEEAAAEAWATVPPDSAFAFRALEGLVELGLENGRLSRRRAAHRESEREDPRFRGSRTQASCSGPSIRDRVGPGRRCSYSRPSGSDTMKRARRQVKPLSTNFGCTSSSNRIPWRTKRSVRFSNTRAKSRRTTTGSGCGRRTWQSAPSRTRRPGGCSTAARNDDRATPPCGDLGWIGPSRPVALR